MVYASFAEGLSALMAERGIGVRALARRVPCSAGYLSRLRSSHDRPSPEMARRFDELLDAGGTLTATVPTRTPASTVRPAVAAATVPSDTPAGIPFAPENDISSGQLEAAVAYLREMWHVLVRADNIFGPRYALAAVKDQLKIIDVLLVAARGDARRQLLSLGAHYAESLAWLYEDLADMAAAEHWTLQAMEWATEAGDQDMVAWTLFRRSQQATTRRNPAQVIGLAQAVHRDRDHLPAPMRAAAAQQEAQGYALDHDERSCHRALDEAHARAQRFDTDTYGDARSGHGSFCTAGYIEIQRAGCWLTLGRPERAISTFEQALTTLPEVYRRDRGLAYARLASAYGAAGQLEHAADHGLQALGIARGSGSVRIHRAVVALVPALTRAKSSPVVARLVDELSGHGEAR